jgi:HEAT repeat protein
MLDKDSPTSRLEGVSWSTRVEKLDPQLLAALVNTLNHDANTNVRLSALDALEKFSEDDSARKAMIDSLVMQKSPLVQIALIDALVHMRDRGAVDEFRKLSKQPDVNAAVQQRARWGLEKLKG